MTDYASFRQRLDAVLRTQDVKQVSDFLIAEKQWSAGTPVDPEAAMWLMIAGSASLQDLHARAGAWLVSHGHEAEAQAVLGRAKKQFGRPGAGAAKGQGARKKPAQASANRAKKQGPGKHERG